MQISVTASLPSHIMIMIIIRSKPGAVCVETLPAGLPEQTLTCCWENNEFIRDLLVLTGSLECFFFNNFPLFLWHLSVTKTLIKMPASCKKIIVALAAAGSMLEEHLLT